jgi:hypothetical protein
VGKTWKPIIGTASEDSRQNHPPGLKPGSIFLTLDAALKRRSSTLLRAAHQIYFCRRNTENQG